MRCIIRSETDPYFNIAAEEYIFRNFTEETFMLWRNQPSVIIGKHQNAFAEVNHAFAKAFGIKVVRRISGGGAVYHDPGNINFTWTSYGEPNSLVDFERFTYPVALALKELGLNVEIGKRHSLYIDGLKISGNAEHAYKNKVIHHGTLLFNSNLEALNLAIKPSAVKYEDKAVKSVRSNVTNIIDYLDKHISPEEFISHLFNIILQHNQTGIIYTLTADDLNGIEALKDAKYKGWDWNFGYSPAFKLETSLHSDAIEYSLSCFVKNGIIQSVSFEEPLNMHPITDKFQLLSTLLTNVRLEESSIAASLKNYFREPEINRIQRALFMGEQPEHL